MFLKPKNLLLNKQSKDYLKEHDINFIFVDSCTETEIFVPLRVKMPRSIKYEDTYESMSVPC